MPPRAGGELGRGGWGKKEIEAACGMVPREWREENLSFVFFFWNFFMSKGALQGGRGDDGPQAGRTDNGTPETA